MVSGVFSIPLDAGESTSRTGSKGRGSRAPLREYLGGEENALVRVAADVLLSNPPRFNPLVFVGPTGVGKSHLALGLVERWKAIFGGHRAIVNTGADFARSYAAAVETDSLADWREKYQAADLVLIDDLQELSAKKAAQQELVHLLDTLTAAGKRFVGTLRQTPSEVPHLAEGLASRLAGGLAVPLTAPGTLARRAILGKLAKLHATGLPPPALNMLAERIVGTVPQLNHAMAELEHACRQAKREVDAEAVDEFLTQQATNDHMSLRTIAAVVAKFFRLKTADLKGPSRRTGVVQARSLAMYLARRLTDESLEQVGQHFGGRDHTTVLHACRKTESLIKTDSETKHLVEELMELVGAAQAV